MLNDLAEFECRRCQACCMQPGWVKLEEGEAERIAEFLNLELYDFTARFCEVVDRRRLVLKKNESESCIFLNQTSCAIHDVKPAQCAGFPIKWRTEKSFDYCEGLRVLKRLKGKNA